MSTIPAPMPDFHKEESQSSSGAHSVDANALRAQIESSQGGRLAGALTPVPRQVRETLPTRISALDAVIGGGLPIGAITELVGPVCSGRTGVALSTLASAMREGSMCAWVDASDALDPESAAANGVRLNQLLWVRCGMQAGVPEVRQTGSARASAHVGEGRTHARAGQHPRDEERGLDRAVGALLRGPDGSRPRDRSIGTPGAPNRPLDGSSVNRTRQAFGPVQREEQVSSDRQPKGDRSRIGVAGLKQDKHGFVGTRAGKASHGEGAPWTRLDQALRAADLLLQAGGFRVLVLDLGNIAPEHALRIPLATWFRFRAATEASRTALLALVQTSCAKSSAGLVICFEALEAQCWSVQRQEASHAPGEHGSGVLQFPYGHPVQNTAGAIADERPSGPAGGLIESVCYQAHVVRQRFTSAGLSQDEGGPRSGRRPPHATWQLSAFPLRGSA